ncbi:MAG: acyl-CoA desaturase [Sandaracinus sp.]|nr:acyl-CoA desaturase [Myxococcales bacterium]MAT27812.1 acyl-CoA desaturase [Sandaracinus sp.]MBJ73738.1 acyl-CoA desaturase [Sandaracinus sp.]
MEKREYTLLGAIPFVVIHILGIGGAFFVEWTTAAVVTCIVSYVVRLWAVTAGYHRYFSHRTFKTGRVFQFILAFLAQTSIQKGVLWWASHHRRHHKYSDLEGDMHSPVRDGFWFSHMGWLFVKGADETEYDRVKDLSRYPELVWLNEHHLVPPIVLGVICFVTMGAPGLFIGFFLSSVLVWHGTFTINSLSHVFGKRRFETTDDSRNNWLLAIVTLGEGWHNNHHRFQASTRQGFYWWEFDITFYVLKVLSALGLVWDLRPVPEKILAEGRAADTDRKAGRTPATVKGTEPPAQPALDPAA